VLGARVGLRVREIKRRERRRKENAMLRIHDVIVEVVREVAPMHPYFVRIKGDRE